MASELLAKITKAQNLALLGLKQCNFELERRVWLHTFNCPRCTAASVAGDIDLSPVSARKYSGSCHSLWLIVTQSCKRTEVLKTLS